MKIKTCFITNSSSSSFIVSFDKIPETKEELKKMMFGDKEKIEHIYQYFDSNEIDYVSTNTMAEIVFKDMKQEATDEEIIEAMSYEFGYVCDYKKYESESDGEYYFDQDSYNKDEKEYAKKQFLKFKEKNKNGKIFIFSYGDDDRLGAMMEHGKIFKNFKHLVVSHH